MSESNEGEIPYIPMEYVCCGRRWSSVSGKLLISIRTIDGSELGEEMVFPFDRKMNRSVGAVYSGASFNVKGARGLSGTNQFLRPWANKTDVIDWQARDEHAETMARSKKLEGDLKKVSEIEKILLPLRVQYDSYRVKRDHAGMEALTAAVVRALASRPRTS